MLRILLLIGYLVIAVNASIGYKYYPEVQQSYKFYVTPQKWFDARNTCRRDNAALAMPKNKAETLVLKNIFEKYPVSVLKSKDFPDYVLLGFHDLFKEGEYVTLKGITIQNYVRTWQNGELNNLGNNEDCGSMDRSGTLNDFPCNVSVAFICQKNKKDISPEYKYFNESNKYYKLHYLNPKVWPEARVVCQNEGGNLAIVNNKAEEVFLLEIFRNSDAHLSDVIHKNQALLGFHDIFKENYFVTVKDEDLESKEYTNWGDNQPDNNGPTGDENCGTISILGQINDFPCDIPSLFFCEIDSESNHICIS